MTDIFNEVVQQVTAKGQMFETKEVLNDNGVTYTEYANFAENLKQFFDIKTGTDDSADKKDLKK